MVKAYVLINVKPETENEVARVLSKTPGVASTDLLFGYYDIIAKIETDNLNDVGKIVENIRNRARGIEKTSTMIVKEDYFDVITSK
jgi:DNA-binding Lrp family transcriptional regulator